MIRTISRTFDSALQYATTFFRPGYKSIKSVKSMPGAKDATPEQDRYRCNPKPIIDGDYPDSLPCFLVIDDNGKVRAACYYLTSDLDGSF